MLLCDLLFMFWLKYVLQVLSNAAFCSYYWTGSNVHKETSYLIANFFIFFFMANLVILDKTIAVDGSLANAFQVLLINSVIFYV